MIVETKMVCNFQNLGKLVDNVAESLGVSVDRDIFWRTSDEGLDYAVIEYDGTYYIEIDDACIGVAVHTNVHMGQDFRIVIFAGDADGVDTANIAKILKTHISERKEEYRLREWRKENIID